MLSSGKVVAVYVNWRSGEWLVHCYAWDDCGTRYVGGVCLSLVTA